MNPRALKVKYQLNHNLVITITNGEIRVFNLTPFLEYPVYAPLKDEAFCKKVKIEDGILQWDEFIDIDPDTLYLESEPLHSLASI